MLLGLPKIVSHTFDVLSELFGIKICTKIYQFGQVSLPEKIHFPLRQWPTGWHWGPLDRRPRDRHGRSPTRCRWRCWGQSGGRGPSLRAAIGVAVRSGGAKMELGVVLGKNGKVGIGRELGRGWKWGFGKWAVWIWGDW